MARQLPSRNRDDFVTGSENVNPDRRPGAPSTPALSDAKDLHLHRDRPCLEELNVGALQNVQNLERRGTLRHTQTKPAPTTAPAVLSSTPDSLADDLHNFHIYSPPDKGAGAAVQPDAVSLSRSAGPGSPEPPRPQRAALQAKRTHFALPEKSWRGAEEPRSSRTGSVQHESFSELLSEPAIQSTIQRHDAGDFNWILSFRRDAGSKHLRRVCSAADLVCSASENRKVFFGCNILRQRSLSRSSVTGRDRAANTYTLIATPLGSQQEAESLRASETPMIDTLLPAGAAAPPFSDDMVPANLDSTSPKAPSASLDAAPLDRDRSLPRSPGSSVARIEDTLEELDRLEDQFEAVHRMVRVNRVASPDKEDRDRPNKAGINAAKKPLAKTGAARPSSVRRSAGSVDSAKKSTETAAAAGAPAGAAAGRLSVPRPLSLLPPKPPARSSKPPTTSTFELPGEAVARRLKEQREARLQAAAAAAAAAAAKSATSHAGQPRRTRSVKPTIPTFELPGEAISRRKRQEHEAKIKQQEEDERKRREFKARPIRLSITPSTVPRETVSSRARANRASTIGEGATAGSGLSVPGTGPSAKKKPSVLSSGPNSATGPVQRGRGQTLGPSSTAAGQVSRATSTSTGSISGKRSTVSVEDVQNQKLRGRQILHRDSVLSSDRDREKREHEAIAKQARREAAERSKALSREWAEKQKLKAKKATAGAEK